MGENNGGAGLPVAIRMRFEDGRAACTDGTHIYYDDRLNNIQRKCAIVHELIHVERGHSTAQREPEEMSVRFETARRLIPTVTDRCAVEPTLASAAKALAVTRQVLMDRASTLSDAEAAAAGCAACRKCPAMAARFDSSTQPCVEQWNEQVQWVN